MFIGLIAVPTTLFGYRLEFLFPPNPIIPYWKGRLLGEERTSTQSHVGRRIENQFALVAK